MLDEGGWIWVMAVYCKIQWITLSAPDQSTESINEFQITRMELIYVMYTGAFDRCS